jgi:flagellar capping protein FliD
VVTNEQLYLALGIPVLLNAMMFGLLMAYINVKIDRSEIKLGAKIESLDAKFEARFQVIESRFQMVDAQFQIMDARLQAMEAKLDALRETWRAELRRVEEILDARLKHLEERR